MIPFTQYLLPDGRRKHTGIERPADIEAKAREIMAHDFVFEAEVLTTGQVSLAIHDIINEEDIDIEVVPNGPDVTAAIDMMIKRFDPESERSSAQMRQTCRVGEGDG